MRSLPAQFHKDFQFTNPEEVKKTIGTLKNKLKKYM